MSAKQILDGPEVEAEYGLKVPWQRKKRTLGDGPPYLKIGRMVRYRRQDIEDYLAARVVQTGETASGDGQRWNNRGHGSSLAGRKGARDE